MCHLALAALTLVQAEAGERAQLEEAMAMTSHDLSQKVEAERGVAALEKERAELAKKAERRANQIIAQV